MATTTMGYHGTMGARLPSIPRHWHLNWRGGHLGLAIAWATGIILAVVGFIVGIQLMGALGPTPALSAAGIVATLVFASGLIFMAVSAAAFLLLAIAAPALWIAHRLMVPPTTAAA